MTVERLEGGLQQPFVVSRPSHRIIPRATHAMRDPRHQRTYTTLLTAWIEEMV